MVQQFIHGTQFIDELVMARLADKGDLYIHQDANWNVIAVTDLGGHLVERSVYTPYGELTVHQNTSFGDRDGDGDVDSTDKGTVGVDCTGTVSGSCRILDLDFDGDYDATDATKFDNLPQGAARHPALASTGVDQPFGHQGLPFEQEISGYQNRHRQYNPMQRRFLQLDPQGSRHVEYVYVDNSPKGRLDPSGAIPLDPVISATEITFSADIGLLFSGIHCDDDSNGLGGQRLTFGLDSMMYSWNDRLIGTPTSETRLGLMITNGQCREASFHFTMKTFPFHPGLGVVDYLVTYFKADVCSDPGGTGNTGTGAPTGNVCKEPSDPDWYHLLAHEAGHAFGIGQDTDICSSPPCPLMSVGGPGCGTNLCYNQDGRFVTSTSLTTVATYQHVLNL